MADVPNNASDYFSVDFVANTMKNTACQFHHCYEICFFTAGHRTYIINEEFYDVTPNSIVIIPPYVQHSTCGTAAATRTVVYFTESFLSDYFSKPFVEELLCGLTSPFCAFTQPSENVALLMETLRNAYFQNNRTRAALHLGLLLTTAKSAQQMPLKEKESISQSTVTRAISYIENHFCTLSSLNELASDLHISLSYLEAIFRKSMGISLMQYIIKSKINYAAKLLLETKKSITEISIECGFNSSTHFSNTFKKHTGVSPREYRR